MLEVGSAYLLAALLVGCALLIALVIALVVKHRAAVRGRLALMLIGMLLLAIAGLEKMGWSSRPWQLGSPAQDFDDFLFRVVWLTGAGFMFLAGIAWFLERRPDRSRIEREPEINGRSRSAFSDANPVQR